MDGLAHGMTASAMATQAWGRSQRTLRAAIDCVGIGLHSGRKARLRLSPADEDRGVTFRRTDLPGAPSIPVRFDRAVESPLCTVLVAEGAPDVRVGTVEHVLAALAGAGVDNVEIGVDGPEVPILDGSAASFLFLIDCAGTVLQDAPAQSIEVCRPVRVEHGRACAELLPVESPFDDGLDLRMSIDFAAPAIGQQSLSLRLSAETFRRELARARTFTLAGEVTRLQAAGLGRGGSLDNAVVVDDARVLNPGGLRMPDEFVRHKMLDAVGDLALAGQRLVGRFVGHCSGHALNNRLLHALFADPANWRLVDPAARLRPAPLSPAVLSPSVLSLHGAQLRAA